jgi:hypothetical protein
MKGLCDYEPEELASLSDLDFQETVQAEARSRVNDAFNTYDEVMSSSEDDAARVKAADKILSLAGFSEKQSSTLLSGVSEEVFKLALAGLGQLAGIAQNSSSASSILRNVTPAAVDPRPLALESLDDDSPLNRNPKVELENDNDAITNILSGERYEIINR